MSNQTENRITALCCRLSQEYEKKGDSDSIINQKEILQRYVKQNGFTNTQVFVDDGYSGVSFNRPGFQSLLELMENGYDSLYTEGNELAPFKNLFNEWYARDTSKKIRAVFKAKAERGERVGTSVPYGYKRDPEKKGHLLIDEVSAQVVRMIYDLFAAGNEPRYIAKILRDKKIVKPTIYSIDRKANTVV